ncbi:response regulator [Roseiflexus sp.]|uniref:response regulator n=1 Tax=Roseiflexus sp. TaxID=2562120 RepID=UPI00398B5AEA
MSAAILVADDHDAIRDLLSRVLTNDGYAVTCVVDGAELLTISAGQTFDLVLTDLSMPKVDGLTAIRRLRMDANSAHLPIIAMSADLFTGYDALTAGANAFLEKPFLLDELLGTITHALRQTRDISPSHITQALANHPPTGVTLPRQRGVAWKQFPAASE